LDSGAVYDWQDRLREDERHVYEYDRNGSLTQKIRKQDGALTLYDPRADGKLRSVVLPDGTHLRYHYDPLGRQVAKYKNNALVWSALYRGKHLWVEVTIPIDC